MTFPDPRQLTVLLKGEIVGRLFSIEDGELAFSYSHGYSGPDLSIAMPYSEDSYSGRHVSAFFENLLPDDEEVREGLAAESDVSDGVFSLLGRFGLDLPGAVQVVPDDGLYRLTERGHGYVQVTEGAIASRLETIIEAERSHRARAWASGVEHWSLGGMQTKLAFREFEGKWYECQGASASNAIVKPGVTGLPHQSLIECTTMRLARACGLPVADVRMHVFDGMDAIVVSRYDRFTSPETGYVTRIHQEDLCQATGTLSAKKYASDGGPSSIDIMRVLSNAEGRSVGRFVDALLFNYLTASTDAHAKNYSLIHPEKGRYLLAPLYDVASIAPYMKRGKVYRTAMSIGGENRVGWLRKASLRRFAKANDIDEAMVIGRAEELATLIMENIESAAGQAESRPGTDELLANFSSRINAICKAAIRNINVESKRFKPADAALA